MAWEERPRVAVLGAGGLGSKLGGLLALHEAAEVWLIHRREEHVRAIREHGLTLVRDGEEHLVRLGAAMAPAEVGPVDLVIVLVKAYDTAAAARQARPLLGPDSLVVTFQNGLGNLEALSAELGADRCVLGVTYHGATLLGPGRVADMGGGATHLAARPDTRERLQRVAEAFSQAAMPTDLRPADEVDGLLWAKLAMVAGINPLAAILRVPNGALGAVDACRALSLDAIAETIAVAAAKGISLPFDPRERFDATTRATAQMSSGTLLDALRGRQTEIDAISGAIAAEGERLSVPTPVSRLLWRLVKAIETTHAYRVRDTTP